MVLQSRNMKAGFVLFASLVSLMILCDSTNTIQAHGSKNLPSYVHKRITRTAKPMNWKAHVIPVVITWMGTYYSAVVSLGNLPSHLNNTFMQDEIFVKVKPANAAKADEMWIKDNQQQTLLARVPLYSPIGYRAVKMRGVFLNWLRNKQTSAILKLEPGKSKNVKFFSKQLGSKAYFVVYTFSTKAPVDWARVSKCHSYDVNINPQSLVTQRAFQTKICSPPNDVTYPYNTSSFFDVGVALREALWAKPIPKGARVLRNPKCCQPTKAVPRFFAKMINGKVEIIKLDNARITECGCWTP